MESASGRNLRSKRGAAASGNEDSTNAPPAPKNPRRKAQIIPSPEVADLRKKLLESEQKALESDEKLRESERRRLELDERRVELEENVAELQDKLRESEQQRVEAERLKDKEYRDNFLLEQHDKLHRDMIDERDKKIEADGKEMIRLQDRNKELTSKVAQLEGQARAHQAQIDSLPESERRWLERVEGLNERVTKERNLLKESVSSLSDTRKKLGEREDELREANTKVNQLNKRLDAEKEKLLKSEKECEEMQSSLDGLETQLKEERERSNDREKKLEQKEADLKRANERIKELTAKLENRESQSQHPNHTVDVELESASDVQVVDLSSILHPCVSDSEEFVSFEDAVRELDVNKATVHNLQTWAMLDFGVKFECELCGEDCEILNKFLILEHFLSEKHKEHASGTGVSRVAIDHWLTKILPDAFMEEEQNSQELPAEPEPEPEENR